MSKKPAFVSLFAALALATAPTAIAQDILVNQQGDGDRLALMNDPFFNHLTDNNLFLGDTNGDGPFILASEEGRNDTAGIYGDGDTLTLWSPGDGAFGIPSSPPAALVYFLDEDAWSDNDADAYNNGAIQIYLDTSGVWQASDRSRKANFAPLESALIRVQAINGYSYEFNLNAEEATKAQVPVRRVGIIAQELEAVLPEAVASSGDGELFVNYSSLTPLLIEAIKEQQFMIAQLQSRLEVLERRPW